MNLIVFTKHLQGLGIEQLAERLKSIGAEGADLCVRPGHPVTPDNILQSLPAAVERFRSAGLSIPMITTPGEFTDPGKPEAEKVFAGCNKSGVKMMKLGYWYMEKGERYWQAVDRIRGLLDGFVKLAGQYEVKVLIHNHSANTMGLNSCSVMNLVKGFDHRQVGVFADPGHLSLVGEPLPMALDIVREYLSAVAAKDVLRERIMIDGKRSWRLRVVPLREGFVDWNTLASILTTINFTGPVSMHSEYSEYDLETVLDQARIDIRFFKNLIAEQNKKK